MEELDRPSPICQYCLADPRYTVVDTNVPEKLRCPVCGANYSGPRRDLEYTTLVENGFVKAGE